MRPPPARPPRRPFRPRPTPAPRPAGLDRVRAARECRPRRRDRAMGALLDLSRSELARSELAPPEPADPRLCELGFAAWETALAEAADPGEADRARVWAASAPGGRFLSAVFGTTAFL